MTNVLVWLREVDDRARADSGDRPSVQQINLVAMHRVLFADPDGRNCYPAQTTLAQKCGLDRKTVRAVDEWLVGSKLMVFERNRSHGQKEYRLESDGGGEHHLGAVDKPSDGVADTHLEPETGSGADTHLESDGCPDGAQMGAPTPTTFHLLPVEKGFTDDPTGRASPADDAWQQAHPHVRIEATA